MTCVVNAMDENGMRLLLSLGHHHHCLYDSHVTRVTNVSDPVRVLLVMSSAASGSMSTSEQDNTWYTHNTHVNSTNTHVNFQLAILIFVFSIFEFWVFDFQFLQNAISIFWFSTFEFLIFNFFKTRFQFFMFQLFKNATSTFQFYNFIILIFEIYKSIFNFIK